MTACLLENGATLAARGEISNTTVLGADIIIPEEKFVCDAPTSVAVVSGYGRIFNDVGRINLVSAGNSTTDSSRGEINVNQLLQGISDSGIAISATAVGEGGMTQGRINYATVTGLRAENAEISQDGQIFYASSSPLIASQSFSGRPVAVVSGSGHIFNDVGSVKVFVGASADNTGGKVEKLLEDKPPDASDIGDLEQARAEIKNLRLIAKGFQSQLRGKVILFFQCCSCFLKDWYRGAWSKRRY